MKNLIKCSEGGKTHLISHSNVFLKVMWIIVILDIKMSILSKTLNDILITNLYIALAYI